MVQYITITREALSKSQGMVRLTTQDWLEPNPRKNREETSYRNKDLETKTRKTPQSLQITSYIWHADKPSVCRPVLSQTQLVFSFFFPLFLWVNGNVNFRTESVSHLSHLEPLVCFNLPSKLGLNYIYTSSVYWEMVTTIY